MAWADFLCEDKLLGYPIKLHLIKILRRFVNVFGGLTSAEPTFQSLTDVWMSSKHLFRDKIWIGFCHEVHIIFISSSR